MNPWHAVNRHPDDDLINAIIEIKQGERAKYEIDKATGLLKLDRVLLPSMTYPTNYGFIPRSYGDDKDPLDILVLSQIKMEPLCLVEARPIGVLRMIDSGDHDEKIIAVAGKDTSVTHLHDISDVPEYLLDEIAHFFSEYKTLEKKVVVLNGFEGKDVARQIILDSYAAYEEMFPEMAMTQA
ncbi:MAG: inorganic diphosphatase [Bacteroidota bacterium]|nr:inorganic diphosphatase [Bacteroidota bacterium]